MGASCVTTRRVAIFIARVSFSNVPGRLCMVNIGRVGMVAGIRFRIIDSLHLRLGTVDTVHVIEMFFWHLLAGVLSKDILLALAERCCDGHRRHARWGAGCVWVVGVLLRIRASVEEGSLAGNSGSRHAGYRRCMCVLVHLGSNVGQSRGRFELVLRHDHSRATELGCIPLFIAPLARATALGKTLAEPNQKQ